MGICGYFRGGNSAGFVSGARIGIRRVILSKFGSLSGRVPWGWFQVHVATFTQKVVAIADINVRSLSTPGVNKGGVCKTGGS